MLKIISNIIHNLKSALVRVPEKDNKDLSITICIPKMIILILIMQI